jgi:uncharacterized protein (TIGR00369 family)
MGGLEMVVLAHSAQSSFEKTRARLHATCFVCSPANMQGLGLVFAPKSDGSVVAEFGCERLYEGYPDMVHGGVVSSLLDGAMTNCLFAQGKNAVTAELRIRFREPVEVGVEANVRAWLLQSSSLLHILKAEFIQNQQVKATAIGKFMEYKPMNR